MKNTFSRMAVVALTLWLGFAAGAANADLTAADGGLTVYDKGANLYWLADANLVLSNNFGVISSIRGDGTMQWRDAQSWIAAMDKANYLGYNDWRLPTTLQPDLTCGVQNSLGSTGLSCTGSEMGNLFYNELGGAAGIPIQTQNNGKLALFQNVPYSRSYWSGTEWATYSDGYAWYFGTNGYQNVTGKFDWLYATAVRPAVPEPETYAMLLAGLGLLGFTAWRRKQNLG